MKRLLPFAWVLLVLACNLATSPTAVAPTASATPPAPTITPSASPSPIPASPTPLPPSSTPTPSASAVPQTLDALGPWLQDAWNARAVPEQVRADLQSAGWQHDAADWANADMDPDGRNEWIVTLYTPGNVLPAGPPGELWIVNGAGVVYRSPAANENYTAPHVAFLGDLTGDGLTDAVVRLETCGASTCTQFYPIVSAHGGAFRNVVQLPDGSVPPDQAAYGIGMASSTAALGNTTPPDLLVTGGTFSSAGAGIQRNRTETWGWDGQAIVLKDVAWEHTNYRHHVLYDANLAFDAGDDVAAEAAYTRVVEDGTLLDADSPATGESAHDSSRQFTMFRLVLVQLRGLAEVEANTWYQRLAAEYPDAAITRAAATLLREWGNTNELATACLAVTSQLAGEADPLGAIADMGYGNPQLKPEDLCPVR